MIYIPLERFVHNRVVEIKDVTAVWSLIYYTSQDNLTDLLTYGITAKQFKENSLWWQGSKWLIDQQQWPKQNDIDSTVLSAVTEESVELPTSSTTPENVGMHKIIKVETFSIYQNVLRVIDLWPAIDPHPHSPGGGGNLYTITF